ncbi:MAG: DUF4258 domain-containing protein [Campylobacterota bacterium]|nr:DUF4258 domain-containing protein [Campylobacterota bacterium]
MNFIYRVHAIERMFQREISEEAVEQIVVKGKVIESYENDKPYPSFLALGFHRDRAIHIVYAKDENSDIIIITAYEPSPEKWEKDMKTRRV